MTLANVFVKTASDRWLAWVIAALSVALFMLFGMSAYREIDLRCTPRCRRRSGR